MTCKISLSLGELIFLISEKNPIKKIKKQKSFKYNKSSGKEIKINSNIETPPTKGVTSLFANF